MEANDLPLIVRKWYNKSKGWCLYECGSLKETINILNFEYLQETDEFHSEFGLLEKKKHFSLTDALAMHFIDYPNKNIIQTFHH
jgi:hypothetical protein